VCVEYNISVYEQRLSQVCVAYIISRGSVFCVGSVNTKLCYIFLFFYFLMGNTRLYHIVCVYIVYVICMYS
jgi:hypothetical protein